jgi:hypothetical protein
VSNADLCDDEDDCLYNSSGDGSHDGKKHKGGWAHDLGSML